MSKLHSIWDFVRQHKYAVVTLFFFISIGFVGDSSLLRRFTNRHYMNTLQDEINAYQNAFNRDTRTLKSLQNDPRTLEKVARERYLMRRPNEDVFVFEEDLVPSSSTEETNK
ncbi:MAG: septum formation initiator family protein [Bacteroidaceae bacterium]|nr:septum formation initiator family protein [Bacteroidaceae bacterium]